MPNKTALLKARVNSCNKDTMLNKRPERRFELKKMR